MNVAIFASAFHPHVGGVEELCRQLAHAYRRRGINAIVVTNRWPRSLPAHESFEQIPVHRIAMRVPEGSLKACVNYYLTSPMIRWQLLQILRKHAIDLLHVQCVTSNGHYACYAKHALGLPLVVTTQGERTMDAAQIFQKSPVMDGIFRKTVENADYLTGCSNDTLDDVVKHYGLNVRDRSATIYNGVDPGDFVSVAPSPHPRPYVLAIGRLVKQKGFDVLIRAFSKAITNAREQSTLASLDLVLAGVGEEADALQQLAGSLQLADRIRFFGRADRPAAAALFKNARFFVLPSQREPLGIVNLEAMAAGKAVIASRVGGVPEIVLDGETGLLVPAEDEAALAQAIARLADDPALCDRLGAAGKKRVAEFAWDSIAAQYAAVYARLLRAPAPQSSLSLSPSVQS